MDVRSHAVQRFAGEERNARVHEGRKKKNHTEPTPGDIGVTRMIVAHADRRCEGVYEMRQALHSR